MVYRYGLIYFPSATEKAFDVIKLTRTNFHSELLKQPGLIPLRVIDFPDDTAYLIQVSESECSFKSVISFCIEMKMKLGFPMPFIVKYIKKENDGRRQHLPDTRQFFSHDVGYVTASDAGEEEQSLPKKRAPEELDVTPKRRSSGLDFKHLRIPPSPTPPSVPICRSPSPDKSPEASLTPMASEDLAVSAAPVLVS